MVYRRFILLIIVRITLIFLNLLGICIIIVYAERFFSSIILLSILIIQIFDLARYILRTNRELNQFLQTVKNLDVTAVFKSKKNRKGLEELFKSFDEIIEILKQSKIEKEAQFQYLKLIMKSVNVGIISLSENLKIELFNDAALSMLQIPRPRSWSQFRSFNSEFADSIEGIDIGEKKLIKVNINNESSLLSVNKSSLKLMGVSYKLITFQNIKSEIEQKEIEAWHNLIRTLAHEIMNSVTPISSLTETSVMLLEDKVGSQKNIADITEKNITSVRTALKTIERRSEGLLNFVGNYRKLTRLPTPQMENISVESLLVNIKNLLKAELSKNNIELIVLSRINNLNIYADPKLIEQVLINLVLNSIDALKETQKPKVQLISYQTQNFTLIEISDNGKGIDKDKLEKIFIPFFSTKEKGTGIGLSLSKQIMKLHRGNIDVRSEKDSGTKITLSFNINTPGKE